MSFYLGGPPRRGFLLAGGVVVLAVLVLRGVQAVLGAVPPHQAIGETGILVTVCGVGAALLFAAREARARGWVVLGLALVAFGAGVIAPLWRLAHPPQVLLRATLGGARREVTLPGPQRAGIYQFDIGGASTTNGAYVLHVLVGDRTERIEGKLTVEPSIFEIRLARRQQVKLFLERSEGWIAVTLRESPAPKTRFRLAGLCGALLAVLADVLATSQRRRGLFTLAVCASVLYVVILDGRAGLTATTVAGAALGAIFGGAVVAVVTGAASGLVAGAAWGGKRRARPAARQRP